MVTVGQSFPRMLELLGAPHAEEGGYQVETLAGPCLFKLQAGYLVGEFARPKIAHALVESADPVTGQWIIAEANAECLEAFCSVAGILRDLPRYGELGPDAGTRLGSSVRISYLYRDLAGSVIGGAVGFAPENRRCMHISHAFVRLCVPDDRGYGVCFVPGQVGVKDLQDAFIDSAPSWNPDVDHPMHEVTGFEWDSRAAQTDSRTFSEFVAECAQLVFSGEGWKADYLPSFARALNISELNLKENAIKMTQVTSIIRTSLNWMDREALVAVLEGISIQCYDHESDDVLRDAIVQNIEDGTLSADDIDTSNVPDRRREGAGRW